jgi:hypothetical protein
MALLDAKEFQFGRQNVWGTTVGAADLPTTNTSGIIQLGDIVLNLSGTIGAPAYWICTTAGTSPVFSVAGTTGIANALRSVAGSATLATSDHFLFITAAGTVTLPAPSTALGIHDYTIKATAQPVTITAASGNLDGVATGSITLSSYEAVNVFTDATNWYTVVRDPEYQIRTAAPPATLSVLDKYVLSPAGALTLPAPAGYTIGRETIVHATASSVTITPTSGNINGGAAVTLAANANSRIFTDGTNFYTAN